MRNPRLVLYLVMLAALLWPQHSRLTIDHLPSETDRSHPISQFYEGFDLTLQDWWSTEGTKIVPEDQHIEVLVERTSTVHGYFAKIRANGRRITSTPFEATDAEIAGTSCARAMIAWYTMPKKKG